MPGIIETQKQGKMSLNQYPFDNLVIYSFISGPMIPRGLLLYKPEVINPFFCFSDSLGLFIWNISSGKNINDKHFFEKQISVELRSITAQNRLIAYMRLPLTAL